MQGYLQTIVIVCVVSAVASTVAAPGKTRAAVQFVLSLAVVLALLSPLSKLGSGHTDFLSALLEEWNAPAAEDEAATRWLDDRLTAATESGLAAALCDRFGLPDGGVRVTLHTEGGVPVSPVTVSLSGGAVSADAPGIVRYIEKNLGLECKIVYGDR